MRVQMWMIAGCLVVASTAMAQPSGPVDDVRDLSPSYLRYMPGQQLPAVAPPAFDGLMKATPIITGFEPTTQPAASPEDAKVMSDLVRELGDDNPKVRSKAAAILRRHGKDALAALALGAKDNDLQVRGSSQTLIDQINNPAKYRAPVPSVSDFALQQQMQIQMQQRGLRVMRAMPNAQVQIRANIMEIGNNAVRDVTVIENGRNVRIHEDANKITIITQTNGQVQQYEAANAEELKTKSPEGYKIYERYAKPK